MKQVLTPEDINFIEEKLQNATPGPWKVLEDESVDTAWVSPDAEGSPIALFDYRSGDDNRANAHFLVCSRNYTALLVKEVKTLRKRVLELIKSNNLEVQKRADLQAELNELKEIVHNSGENGN